MSLMFPKPIPRERKPAWKKAPHSKFCACSKCERKRARKGIDEGRDEFCRSRECVGLTAFPDHICSGAVQASHERNPMGGLPTGTGRKEDSRKTAPKCDGLHKEWEQYKGHFADWTHEQRFYWMRDRYNEVNSAWDALSEAQKDWWRGQAEVNRRRRAESRRGF